MYKLCLAIAMLFLWAGPANAPAEGFRNSSWGDTVEMVNSAEYGNLKQVSPTRYFVPLKVLPLDGEAYFDFADGRLYQGVYVFIQNFGFQSDYSAPDEVVGGELSDDDFGASHIRGWEVVANILNRLYGESENGRWTDGNTSIRLILAGEARQSVTVIQYRSMDLGPKSIEDFTENWVNAVEPMF